MTGKKDVNDIISRMVQIILENFDPYKIILFGSYARNSENIDSDIDLLLVMEVPDSKRALRLKVRKLLHGMGIAKDVFIATPEEIAAFRDVAGTIIQPALREGKVLYEKAA